MIFETARTLPRRAQYFIRTRGGLTRIVRNVAWIIADRIVRLVVGVVVGAWLARYLGPEQYGLLNFAASFVALFSPLATLGLDVLIVTQLARQPEEAYQILGTAFFCRVGGGLIGCLLSVSAIIVLRPGEHLVWWLVTLSGTALILQAFDVITFWFQSKVHSRTPVIARLIVFSIAGISRISLIVLGAPVLAFAWLSLAEIVLGALALIIAYFMSGQHITLWSSSRARIHDLAQAAWPLLLAVVCVSIYQRIDVVMLAALRGDAEVGVYAAATRISELWYFLPSAIAASTTPMLIAAKATSKETYFARLQLLFGAMTAVGLGVAIPMTALSSWLVMVLFGSAYATAGPILAIHIWSGVFVFLGVAQSTWDITEGLTRIALQRNLAGAVVNILLNLILIPYLGGIGAAFATVGSYACACVFMNAVYTKTRPIFWAQLRWLLVIPALRVMLRERMYA